MNSLFDGKKSIFMWQFDAQMEQSIADVDTTLIKFAPDVSVLLIKAMNGSSWQSTWDVSDAAISGLERWQGVVREGATYGLTVLPWVVARHVSDAEAHAKLGDDLIVDLEDDPDNYWADPVADIATYLQRLGNAGVKRIYLCVDPRKWHMDYLRISSLMGFVNGILTQSYWPLFGRPYQESVDDVQAALALTENVYPVIPYDATQADASAFWQACTALGVKGVSFWRLGSADQEQLWSYNALTVPPVSDPAPDPCDDLRQQVATIQAQLDQTNAELAQVVDAAKRAFTALFPYGGS